MRTVVSLLALCAGLAACGSDSPTEPSPSTVTSIVVTSPSTLQVGESVTATARLINSKGDDVTTKTPSWSSSSATIATVDQTGRITAHVAGVATITAPSSVRCATDKSFQRKSSAIECAITW